jgi:hypothetical protein
MCPQCRSGRLRVINTSAHPEFGFAGIETHEVRCDRAECGYAGSRLYEPSAVQRGSQRRRRPLSLDRAGHARAEVHDEERVDQGHRDRA